MMIIINVDAQADKRAKYIGQTTLRYLGGAAQLKMMLGAHDFFINDSGDLVFRFQGCQKANAVAFRVNGLDLYDILFFKTRNGQTDLVAEYNDLYCDQIQDVFEQYTRMYMTLV